MEQSDLDMHGRLSALSGSAAASLIGALQTRGGGNTSFVAERVEMIIQTPQKYGLYIRQATCPEHHAIACCPVGIAPIDIKRNRHFAGCLSA